MLAYLLLTALSCMCLSLLQADGLAQSGDFVKVLLIAKNALLTLQLCRYHLHACYSMQAARSSNQPPGVLACRSLSAACSGSTGYH
jgi:hypothetical protein